MAGGMGGMGQMGMGQPQMGRCADVTQCFLVAAHVKRAEWARLQDFNTLGPPVSNAAATCHQGQPQMGQGMGGMGQMGMGQPMGNMQMGMGQPMGQMQQPMGGCMGGQMGMGMGGGCMGMDGMGGGQMGMGGMGMGGMGGMGQMGMGGGGGGGMDGGLQTGTVKSWNDEKGFGFIIPMPGSTNEHAQSFVRPTTPARVVSHPLHPGTAEATTSLSTEVR